MAFIYIKWLVYVQKKDRKWLNCLLLWVRVQRERYCLQRTFKSGSLKPIVMYTTRPMREGETDGKEYFLPRIKMWKLIRRKIK